MNHNDQPGDPAGEAPREEAAPSTSPLPPAPHQQEPQGPPPQPPEPPPPQPPPGPPFQQPAPPQQFPQQPYPAAQPPRRPPPPAIQRNLAIGAGVGVAIVGLLIGFLIGNAGGGGTPAKPVKAAAPRVFGAEEVQPPPSAPPIGFPSAAEQTAINVLDEKWRASCQRSTLELVEGEDAEIMCATDGFKILVAHFGSLSDIYVNYYAGLKKAGVEHLVGDGCASAPYENSWNFTGSKKVEGRFACYVSDGVARILETYDRGKVLFVLIGSGGIVKDLYDSWTEGFLA